MIENEYYVYIHTRLDNGTVFYVGKGVGRRFKDTSGRNIYWKRVASKSEWFASVVQDEMDEDSAYLLEQWLIAKFRHNGVRLTNLTDGGEGGQGIPSVKRRKIYCSNGMIFDCGKHAADFCIENGYINARQGHIASCCRGERARAYGFAWSYDNTPVDDAPLWKEAIGLAHGKKVFCSDGRVFKSCAEAARIIGGSQSRISSAASGTTKTAYGLSWWYDGFEKKPVILSEVSVECIGYGKFDSLVKACEWLKTVGQTKAQGRPISECCSGKYSKAYGYTWRYA